MEGSQCAAATQAASHAVTVSFLRPRGRTMTNPDTAPLPPASPLFSDDARAELRACAVESPQWSIWLSLLETALTAADEPAWHRAQIGFARVRPERAPLLEDAQLTIDGSAAVRLLDALLEHAAAGSARASAVQAVTLLRAAIAQVQPPVSEVANDLGVEVMRLHTVAHFLALPLLLEAARRAEPLLPSDWRAGYCLVCGAWPTLAETRGLDRRRVLRCGRCAAAWESEVLRCTFCDERDHRRLGSMLPREGGELVRIETCESCRGYLKSVTTLRARPAWALPLDDLRTLPLELKAIERKYQRPSHTGWSLQLHMHSSAAAASPPPAGTRG
jgi:FdhE protein